MTLDLFGFDAVDPDHFEPTPAAALARLHAVRPSDYARTRNHLEGAVTRLSPYLTHGLLSLPQVLQAVRQRHPGLPMQHKLVQELGWRAYFHHVWAHDGDGILSSRHAGPLPDAAYAQALPADLREARTGVPAIDAAVRALYRTGWLHNHARMWLASYTVHLRKVHWRTGADWMFGHLLDGDLASNHLSWQWVAGTASHKPYLFNADNVARFAPAAWHSPGSVIDCSYEALDRLARHPAPVPGGTASDGIQEPPRRSLRPAGFTPPDAAAVRGRPVWLVHPWSLADPPADLPADTLRVGVCVAPWHAAWPWSEGRWQFTASRMSVLCSHLWWGDAAALTRALTSAAEVRGQHNPHLGDGLEALALAPVETLFDEPGKYCDSFSQYWARVTPRSRKAGG